MDNIDKKILSLLVQNARMPVKEIAGQVVLTAPAVSERIKKMERDGTINGYTVRMGYPEGKDTISAVIDVAVQHEKLEEFRRRIVDEPLVQNCMAVTGSRTHVMMVHCPNIETLEKLVSELQSYGTTNTQVVLSTLVRRQN